MNIDTTLIKTSKLLNNNGQIEGVPKNPRFIRNERFETLVKSIEDDPELMYARELIVYPYGDKFVVLGGNMRLRACRQLGWQEIPCKVLPELNAVKLRAIVIKDNVAFGSDDWEGLANEWDAGELEEWGVEILNEKEEKGQKDNTKTECDTCPTCGQDIKGDVPF